jgi:nucleotide-binding universal stress UspA family protein
MFGTILVPLDGSDLAERALPYAVRLAAAGNGGLVLVRVALAPAPVRLDGADWEQQQLDAVKEAEAYLTTVGAKLRPRVPVKWSAPYGRAAHETLEAITRVAADAVVMATHGRTGLAHLLYGSVAEAVLAKSPVPVFLAHARAGDATAPPANPSTACAAVPLDGSVFAEAALETAADLVGQTGELVLVCVVERPTEVTRDEFGRVLAYLDQQEEARMCDARVYLARLATQLKEQCPRIRTRVEVRLGEPAKEIVAAAADNAADVVVMSTHGRTGVRRAVFGSVAGAVLRTASIPVLLVGPHESHRSAEVRATRSMAMC